jgi:hypothetical protein
MFIYIPPSKLAIAGEASDALAFFVASFSVFQNHPSLLSQAKPAMLWFFSSVPCGRLYPSPKILACFLFHVI